MRAILLAVGCLSLSLALAGCVPPPDHHHNHYGDPYDARYDHPDRPPHPVHVKPAPRPAPPKPVIKPVPPRHVPPKTIIKHEPSKPVPPKVIIVPEKKQDVKRPPARHEHDKTFRREVKKSPAPRPVAKPENKPARKPPVRHDIRRDSDKKPLPEGFRPTVHR